MFSVARGLAMLWMGIFLITGLGSTFGIIGTGGFLKNPVPIWITE
jgi:hypothetical protein